MTPTTNPTFLSGLTREEAMNYINHLPGLLAEERDELIIEAQRKPLNRQTAVDTLETIDLRIKCLVDYLKDHPFATRKAINDRLKYNGANMRRTISEAVTLGLVRVTDGRLVTYSVTSKGLRPWRRN